MLVMFRPTFFDGKDLCACDVCTRIVFIPEALRDPEVRFVVVSMRAGLLVALGDFSVPFCFGIVVPVGFCVCVKDV